MSLTISSCLIGNSANGFRSIVFRDIGSAASRVVSSSASVTAAGDHIAITAGSRLSAQSAGHNQGIANAAEETAKHTKRLLFEARNRRIVFG